MKIDDSLSKVANSTNDRLNKTNRNKTETDNTSNSAAKDSVKLSAISSQLQSLEAKLATDNVFDADKVDSIKAAISNGTFKIDTEKVADGLISTAKDLVLANKI